MDKEAIPFFANAPSSCSPPGLVESFSPLSSEDNGSDEDYLIQTVIDAPYNEADFYGESVPDKPAFQEDDEMKYLAKQDRQKITEDYLRAISSPPENAAGDKTNNDKIIWTERLISKVGEPAIFVLDRAVIKAHKILNDEVAHLQSRMYQLMGKDARSEKISFEEVLNYFLGPKSEFCAIFCREMMVKPDEFQRFIATCCAQMSYKETPSGLFDNKSLVVEKMVMTKERYHEIWGKIAKLKKIQKNNFAGSARREECLWEIFETCINDTLRTITVAKRSGKIYSALDDDKCWIQQSGENLNDTFKLRKVKHVNDNRDGIVVDTCASSTINIPMAIHFEREGEKSVDCFKKKILQYVPLLVSRQLFT